jgi:hypothetical protein
MEGYVAPLFTFSLKRDPGYSVPQIKHTKEDFCFISTSLPVSSYEERNS